MFASQTWERFALPYQTVVRKLQSVRDDVVINLREASINYALVGRLRFAYLKQTDLISAKVLMVLPASVLMNAFHNVLMVYVVVVSLKEVFVSVNCALRVYIAILKDFANKMVSSQDNKMHFALLIIHQDVIQDLIVSTIDVLVHLEL